MKTQDIQFEADVRIIYEFNEDEFAALAGRAEVISSVEAIERRWRPSYDKLFPTTSDRCRAVFIDVRAQEMQLWIRGLTPEPFGLRSLGLYRPGNGDWRLRAGSDLNTINVQPRSV